MEKEKPTNFKRLKYHELKIGMDIIDEDGTIGTITKIDDAKNVQVDFKYGLGIGLYCLDSCCNDFLYSCNPNPK